LPQPSCSAEWFEFKNKIAKIALYLIELLDGVAFMPPEGKNSDLLRCSNFLVP
jgi:hypothetical protein